MQYFDVAKLKNVKKSQKIRIFFLKFTKCEFSNYTQLYVSCRNCDLKMTTK